MINYLYEDGLSGGVVSVVKAIEVTSGLVSHGEIYDISVGTSFTLTGYYVSGDGYDYLQSVEGWWLMIPTSAGSWSEYISSDCKKSRIERSRQQAQQLVNQIIRNNQIITCNNLLCARFANKLTKEQKQRLYELQSRLEARNASLVNDDLVTVSGTSSPAGYVELQSYLDSFMESGGIGSVTAAIVIAAIVIASLSTAAYFVYKRYAEESERDVKFSNDLTRTLKDKLTEKEYQQLLQETRGIVTRAKLSARLGANKWLIWGGLALLVAGVIMYKREMN